MKHELVSVVIVTYNYGKYIRTAIDSVLSQTEKNLEVVVVDDSSEDDTAEVVRGYSDSRIKYHLNKQRLGPIYAANVGTKLAKGKYICALDADDYLPPDSLRIRLDAIGKYDVDVVHAGLTRVERNKTERYIAPVSIEKSISVLDFLDKKPNGSGINLATFLYKKKVFDVVGLRTESPAVFPHDDYAFALKVALRAKVVSVTRTLITMLGTQRVILRFMQKMMEQ